MLPFLATRRFAGRSLNLALALPLLAVPVLATPAFAQTITFKDHGKVVATEDLDRLEKELPARDVTVQDPQEGKPVTYRAFSVASLFSRIYGKSWRTRADAEEILFTCTDGYQPSIPRSDFRQAQAFFAWSKASGGAFSVAETLDHEKNVQLGPLYLIWDNLRDARLRAEGGVGWPYQIATIDLVRFSDRFPKLAPPEKSPSAVKLGFSYYSKYCMECHSLNGEGGKKAPELSTLAPTLTDAELELWISDPKAVRSSTQMPAFVPAMPGRDRSERIRDIIRYLRAMAPRPNSP